MSYARTLTMTLLLFICAVPQAHALSQPNNTNLADINHHQQGATSALLLGDHTLLEPGEFSVSGDVYLSSWTTDALYGAWGLSFQGGLGDRWVLGLSYGFTDAQLSTHAWLLNGNYSLVSGPEPWLRLQTALGYQFLDSADSGNVIFFEHGSAWPIQPDNPLILLDDLDWIHGYLNFHASWKLWLFRPAISLGYMYSRYSWSSWEMPLHGGIEEGVGQTLSDSGYTETMIWSLGLGLDLGPVRPFVGLGTFQDGGLFLARLSIVF